MPQMEVSDTIKRAITEGGTFFTADLIKLYTKADFENKTKLKRAYPVECAAYDAWMASADETVPDTVTI